MYLQQSLDHGRTLCQRIRIVIVRPWDMQKTNYNRIVLQARDIFIQCQE